MSYQPTRVLQTHFGPVGDLERLARDLHAALVELCASAPARAGARPPRPHRANVPLLSVRLDEHGYRATSRSATRCSTKTCA